MLESLEFKITRENTGGGCIVYALTACVSNITILLNEEIAQLVVLDNGKLVNPLGDNLTEEEYDQAWSADNYIEIWHFNRFYPEVLDIKIGVMKLIGFHDSEIDGFIRIMADLINTDWRNF